MSVASSLHNINSDLGLSKFCKIKWIIFNWLNNILPNTSVDPELVYKMLRFSVNDKTMSHIYPKSSPSRVLSDIFWGTQAWNKISNQLGGGVSALEVGCGSGRYGLLLSQLLEDKLVEYKGVDINRHQDWEKMSMDKRFNFFIGDSVDITEHLKGVNFLVTQSALEHFENDILFFRQVANYVKKSDIPFMQIHLFPSAGCLTTFPWHGVRQYTPRTISKITRLFGSETQKELYSLGSAECNKLHKRYITIPKLLNRGDLRETKTEEYNRELKAAIEHDQKYPKSNEACFYALVLKSNILDD